MRLAVIPAPYSLPFQCRPESEPDPVLPGIPLPGRLDPGFHRNNRYFNDTPGEMNCLTSRPSGCEPGRRPDDKRTPRSDELPRQPPAGYRAGGYFASAFTPEIGSSSIDQRLPDAPGRTAPNPDGVCRQPIREASRGNMLPTRPRSVTLLWVWRPQ